jgi:phosphatidylglycerophosphatase A
MKKIYTVSVLFVATGMFAGYIPFAPGTFGSMIGAVVYYAASRYLHLYQSLLLFMGLFLVGTYAADRAEKILNEQDSGKIVIDEIAGMYITMLFIPVSFASILIGFLCFRAFDIIKPFPISSIDAKVHGGLGVMLDDVVAGLFANIVVHMLIFLYRVM